jgi:DNA-binding transcriptional ArsR family regulator
MDKLIVMSLEDESSKQLAKVLGNDTALKMLNKLAEKRCSASELSKQLDIPISTIQYNLDLLIKSNMIKETAYRYSEKGKRVPYYEPMKKLIIIAPESEKSSVFNILKDKFLMPIVIGLIALIGFGLRPFFAGQQIIQTKATEAAADVLAGPIAGEAVEGYSYSILHEPVIIFVLGGIITIAVMMLLYYIKRKLRR